MAIETFPTPNTNPPPQKGDEHVTADGKTYIWNGFAWELECSGGGGVVSGDHPVYYGVTPPDDAETGSLFTQENTLKQYVLQDDGTWVEITSCSGGSGGNCNFTDLECESIRALISPYVTFDRYFHFTAYESSLGIFVNAVRFEWSSNESEGFYDGPYEWEIDLTGDDNWKDVSALTADEITKSGWQQQDLTQSIRINFTNPAGDGTYTPNADYPCLRVRCTASNYNSQDLEAKKTTPPLYVFVDAPHNQAPANESPAPKPSWCTI